MYGLPVSIVLLSCLLLGCSAPAEEEPFALVGIDTIASAASRYPVPARRDLVGSYPALTKSGGGFFYDEVLEYRVWMHPERGAAPLAGERDYFRAFAEYERAAAFAARTAGAEEPLVLVRQREWINEPSPGTFEPRRDERITEWQVSWLADSRRGPNSIRGFLARTRSEGSDSAAEPGAAGDVLVPE